MLKVNKKISISQDTVIYIITIAFMIVPFLIAVFGGTEQYISTKQEGFIWKTEKEVINYVTNPFEFGALTALLGCLIYTIVLIRNNETLFLDGEKKKVNIKMLILHLSNLLFSTSIFAILPANISLFGANISSRAMLVFALILSLLSIKSLSGILWIILAACILPSLTRFDNWRVHGFIYVILSYISLVSQFFILKVFKFDANEVLKDIGIVGNQIKGDVGATVEVAKKTVDTAAKVTTDAAKVAMGV